MRIGSTVNTISCLALLLLCSLPSGAQEPIRVGFDQTPPFYSVSKDGRVTGLAVDVLNEAARRAGYRLDWKPQDRLATEAIGGHFVDMWPLVAKTPGRALRFAFSDPWLETDYLIVSLQSHPVVSPEDAVGSPLTLARRPMLTQIGRTYLHNSLYVPIATREEALRAVCDGSAAATVMESRMLDAILLHRPAGCESSALRVSTIPGSLTRLGLMADLRFEPQVRRINAEIVKMAKDGTLNASLDRWCPFTAEATRAAWESKSANDVSTLYRNGVLLFSFLCLILLFVLFRSARLRKAAEDARAKLRDSEKLFDAFLNHSPAHAFLKDEKGRMIRANASWQNAYGRLGVEYQGKTETELWTPDVARRLREQDQFCRETLQPLEVVERLPNHAGETRVWLVSKFPIQNEDGTIYVGGTSLDITEREASNAELAASNLRYRMLFDLNPLPAWVFDRENKRFLAVNKAAQRHYGWTEEEFLRHITLRDIEGRGAGDPDRGSGPIRHFTKDGRIRKAEVTTDNLEYFGRPACLAIMRDVTEQEMALEQLRLSEDRWQLALQGAGDGLWDWDIVRNVVFRSPRCLDMLGYKPNEIGPSREAWLQLIHPADVAAMREALEDHLSHRASSYSCEYRVRHQDGTWRWLLDRGQGVWDERGRPVRVAGSHTDVTTRKLAEERLSSEANTDALTGLANRREFNRVINSMVESARHSNQPLSLCICDLDRFKETNDTFGHRVGDHVLFTFASIARDTLRKDDFGARTGGDEFVLLLPRTTAQEAMVLVERLRAKFQSVRFEVAGKMPFHSSCSFGVAELSAGHLSGFDLFEAADTSLYEAKKHGRNCVLAA